MLWLALVLAGCGPGPRTFEAPVSLGGVDVAPEVLNRGEIVYMTQCRGCHGTEGRGDGRYAESIDTPPADLTTGRYPRTAGDPEALPTDAQLRSVLTDGIEGTPMGPQGLEGEQLEAVLQYTKTLAAVWRE